MDTKITSWICPTSMHIARITKTHTKYCVTLIISQIIQVNVYKTQRKNILKIKKFILLPSLFIYMRYKQTNSVLGYIGLDNKVGLSLHVNKVLKSDIFNFK